MTTPHDPQQPSYTPPQFQDPRHPGAPAKKSWFARHKILTALGALVVVAVVIGIASGGSGDDGTGAPDPGPAAAAGEAGAQAVTEAPAGIGTPVRDGKFEFIVRSVEPGVPSVGSDFLAETAQGEFVLVTVAVQNIGDRGQSFTESAQKLLDPQGRQFSVDSMATLVLDHGIGYEQINPGNSVEATLVFDVPAGTVPAALELHDSLFSGGVTVSLTP